MAALGQQLLNPEAGWKRIDDRDVRILYSGPKWKYADNAANWGGGAHVMPSNPITTEKCIMAFEGTKFRLVSSVASDYTTDLTVKVDGFEYPSFSANGTAGVMQLLFEVKDLVRGKHIVEIYAKTDLRRWGVDCVDIDSDGKMVHPYLQERTSVRGMSVGDVIVCDYTATSGEVGTFSNLGSSTKLGIGRGATATPDGSFFFIKVGHDHKGRSKLVADRPIQHSISWNKLNTRGVLSGDDLSRRYSGSFPNGILEAILTVLTGSSSYNTVNKVNEWDKIIAEYNLGDKIEAGSDAVWSYNGIMEWTTTTTTYGSDYMMCRGTSLTAINSIRSTSLATTVGYRPVLLVDSLGVPPSLDVSVDAEAVFSSDVRVLGTVTDTTGESLVYRVITSAGYSTQWSAPTAGTFGVDIEVPFGWFSVGYNTVTLEVKGTSEVTTKSFTVIRKAIDSTYVVSGENHSKEKALKSGAGSVAYVAIDSPKPTSGYIIGGSLTLKVLSGTGSIVAAPVLAPWTSATLDANNPPPVATVMATTLEVTASGVVTLDISELAKHLRNNSLSDGIAIYGVSAITFDVLGISVDYTYQPTELYLPEKVYGNKVLLKWKPYILERPESVASVKLLRSASVNMAGATTVFETTNLAITQYEDTTVTKGTFHYAIEVNYTDNAYSGLQLDFDLADEAGFIQQDAVNGTDFANGVVTLKKYSATVVVLTFTDSTGLTYDPAKVTVADGIIRLKPSS